MKKLTNLSSFRLDEAQLQTIKAGMGPYDLESGTGTQQVGGGYCTSGGYDCQDAIYNDQGGVIGWAPIQDIAPPDPSDCYTG